MNANSNIETININLNANAASNENCGAREVNIALRNKGPATFSIGQLILHCEKMGICAAGLEYIKRVATSPPSRRVRSGLKSNVVCRFPSKKMGVTIQAENLRNRLSEGVSKFEGTFSRATESAKKMPRLVL